MIVRAARNEPQPCARQSLGQRLRIIDHLLLIGLEIVPQSFAKCHGLRGDDVDKRAALDARENAAVEVCCKLFAAKDQARLAGPRRVLCVVVVTNSQCGIGDGCSPTATSPAIWAISAMTFAPTLRAISPMRAKSIVRG